MSTKQQKLKKKSASGDSESTKKNESEKKGFFATIKDMMYASADDDIEEEAETRATLENISEVLAEINDEIPVSNHEEIKAETEKLPLPEQVTESGHKESKIKPVNEDVINKSGKKRSGKYHLFLLVIIYILFLGVIIVTNHLISGKNSSHEKYRKAVYPAVITDINAFENPSELPVSQILSTAIWSVVIDSEKLSEYPQRVNNMAIIPAEDIENYAVEIFGENIPELTHSTIVTADSRFYYNEDANSYSVEINPHIVTYSPEVLSVSKENGNYIVEVNYIEPHPDWTEAPVSKTVVYSLSGNSGGGYTIESMHESVTE
ncbi:MAG: hypothetical protein K2J39_04765 [Ruminococcus sp.]|nr:hypothetical protein [Ruminococcus sp.]